MPKVGCSVTPRKSLVGRERMLNPPAEKVTPSAQLDAPRRRPARPLMSMCGRTCPGHRQLACVALAAAWLHTYDP